MRPDEEEVYRVNMETGERELLVSLAERAEDAYGTCTKCGAAMSVVRKDEPLESLE